MRNLIWFSLILLLSAACQKKAAGTSNVSFTFPSAAHSSGSSSKVGTMSVDFAKVCYMANVKGGTIPSTKKTACDVPLGIHTEFKVPGSEVSLMVPRGTGYTLEIYAYNRPTAAEACPVLSGESLSGVNITKLHLVGSTTFDVDKADVSVNVSVTDPGSNVATQFSMPTACTAVWQPSGGSIIVSNGGLRFYRGVDSSDGVSYTSANGLGLVLGKDGSR